MVVSTKAQRGSLFTRSFKAIGLGGGLNERAAAWASEAYPDTPGVGLWLQRAASGATTSGDADGAFTAPGAGELIGLVRERPGLGQLNLTRVPFRRAAPLATGGFAASWVGAGAPAPVGKLTWSAFSLDQLKMAGITVFTEDVLRDTSPATEARVRDELVAGLAGFRNDSFFSSNAAVAGTSPAGILNGITGTLSGGDPKEDLRVLLGGFEDLEGVAVAASGAAAVAFANAQLLEGGRLFGLIPLVVTSAAGDNIIGIHQPSVLLADEGGVEIDVVREASIEMDTAPTNDSATPTAAALVSLWQTHAVAFKVSQFINWERRNADAVRLITGAAYAS